MRQLRTRIFSVLCTTRCVTSCVTISKLGHQITWISFYHSGYEDVTLRRRLSYSLYLEQRWQSVCWVIKGLKWSRHQVLWHHYCCKHLQLRVEPRCVFLAAETSCNLWADVTLISWWGGDGCCLFTHPADTHSRLLLSVTGVMRLPTWWT